MPDVTQRFDINAYTETLHCIPGLETLIAPSRANLRHARHQYFSSQDAEGVGWRYEVEAEWFRGVIETLEQNNQLHLYEDHLQEIEKLVKQTSYSGMVEIEWAVAVLLSTRK